MPPTGLDRLSQMKGDSMDSSDRLNREVNAARTGKLDESQLANETVRLLQAVSKEYESLPAAKREQLKQLRSQLALPFDDIQKAFIKEEIRATAPELARKYDELSKLNSSAKSLDRAPVEKATPIIDIALKGMAPELAKVIKPASTDGNIAHIKRDQLAKEVLLPTVENWQRPILESVVGPDQAAKLRIKFHKDELETQCLKKLGPAEAQNFKANLTAFEEKIQKLPPAQQQHIYEELHRFASAGKLPVDEAARLIVLSKFMHDTTETTLNGGKNIRTDLFKAGMSEALSSRAAMPVVDELCQQKYGKSLKQIFRENLHGEELATAEKSLVDLVACKSASAEHVKVVQEAYDKQPEKIKNLLRSQGWQIVAAGKITDAMPELRGVKPRGWPPGSTWDSTAGLCDSVSRRVVLGENRIVRDEGGNEKKQKDGHAEGGCCHEIGHAVDKALQSASESDDFKQAYQKDLEEIEKLPEEERNRVKQTFAYFLQEGNAGREETWADLYAATTGKPSYPCFKDLSKYFPRSSQTVKDQVAKVPG